MNQIAHFVVNLAHILRHRPPAWQRLTLVYVVLKMRQRWLIMTGGARQPGRARFLHFEVRYFNINDFIKLFEDIFIQQHYRTEPLGAQPLILDCGSNIGVAALYLSWQNPQARIIAFEPDPRTFELLQQNLAANGLRNFEAVNAALGDIEGTTDFYYEPSQPGSLTMSAIKERRHATAMVVALTRLSGRFDGDVALVKLDVEGAEHAVMRDLAAAGRLGRIDRMIIEYHHHIGDDDSLGDFLMILEDHGFGYQVAASRPRAWRSQPQDIHIFAYRKMAGQI